MPRVETARESEYIDYQIEPMTAHDLLEVVEIEEACRLSLWGWDSYHSELLRPEAIMLVARRARPDQLSGRSLFGFLSARVCVDELHINNIGVRETARRRGVGHTLLSTAIAMSKQLGAFIAVLEVRAGNAAAQSLYLRSGFEIGGRRRNYYHDPVEDALLMNALLRHPT
ncbi:MAG: ribosomal protein S18-alanine N-acetyltransferase [Pyrinomonadaceae bacterium]